LKCDCLLFVAMTLLAAGSLETSSMENWIVQRQASAPPLFGQASEN